MKKAMIHTIIIFLLLFVFVVNNADASNFYVRPNSSNNYAKEDGADWNNAFNGMPVESSNFWTSTIQAGDIIYVAGGKYTKSWEFGSGGSDNNTRITIKKATVDDHGTDVGWEDVFDSQVLLDDVSIWIKVSNITIDGQVPDGIRIYRPTKGTAGIGWPTIGTDNVTLRYFQIEGPGYEIDFNIYGTRGVDVTPSSGRSNNITIEYCDIFNQPSQIYFLSVNNSIVQNCELHHGSDTTAPPNDDHENVLYSDNSNEIIVRYNIIHDYAAEGIFIRSNQNNWEVYGNVFYDGFLGVETRTDYTHKNINIYNNTFVNIYGPIRYRGINDTGEAKNNLIYPSSPGVIYSSTVTHDYNWYFGDSSYNELNGIAGGNENPFEDSGNYNFYLKDGSSAIDSGASDLGSEYEKAFNVISRKHGKAWDIGAYEFVDSPENLRIIK